MKKLSFLISVIAVIIMNVVCDKDHPKNDPCEGLPPDSCQVDTCVGDTCYSCDGIPGQWEFLGLAGEQITSIAFHPTNPSIMFVATDWDFSSGKLGVIYKSTDCGHSWDTLLLVGGSVADISLDPVNPQIIYASPYDLQKSTDGGMTWQSTSDGIQIDFDTRIRTFAIDPQNTNVLYAGTGGFFGGNLYKSTDGGTNWVRILRPFAVSVTCMELDLKNPGTIYAGLSESGTLMKSTDFGAIWDTTGLKLIYELLYDIFIDEDGCIYVEMSGGISKSCDGGETWVTFNEGFKLPVHIGKMIRNTLTDDFFATPGDDGFLYRRNFTDTSWVEFHVADGITGFSFIDLKMSHDQKYLYVGPKGLYRYRFPHLNK